MNTILTTGRKLLGHNRAAHTALAQHLERGSMQAATQARSSKDIINITVESKESDIITDSGGEKYSAIFSALLHHPSTRELRV
mmetsp:Transcript_30874/g.66444  ORF Transcript_30874/g.66444 Transcript_30874/m.66444 type:complete len:83 (-) Transcript_30874:21-269(-)